MALAYISIGSNLGNRLSYLEQGLYACSLQIGNVRSVSTVVETPAMGFEGNPFLNACFTIEAECTALELMQQLLAIEEQHGRTRNSTVGYQNRTLDLDLLFYDDLVLNESALTLPHPSMHERRFVLQPLTEIAPNKVHPITQKTITALLAACNDNTALKPIPQSLLHPMYALIKQYDYICVEGIIGSG